MEEDHQDDVTGRSILPHVSYRGSSTSATRRQCAHISCPHSSCCPVLSSEVHYGPRVDCPGSVKRNGMAVQSIGTKDLRDEVLRGDAVADAPELGMNP